jgi:O-acetyl-ADP-ribose deacetylase (regulator of RNase III)
MPFTIVRNDITRMRVDAIVNSAAPHLLGGGGADGAIHQAAGPELKKACRALGGCKPGQVKHTLGYHLPCRYVFHTVGPVWEGGDRGEEEKLASCYRKSLLLADQLSAESIAFPLISSGIYGYPRDRALRTALDEIGRFLESHDMDVILVVYDKSSFELSGRLSSDVRQYIDDHYVEDHYRESVLPEARRRPFHDNIVGHAPAESSRRKRRKIFESPSKPAASEHAPHGPAPEDITSVTEEAAAPYPSLNLDHLVSQVGESFQERLLHLIDERGLTDVEVYKKANMDRKLFSKIRCKPDYSPKKRTALALAVALELDLKETQDLIGRAGMAFSPSSPFDLIVEYCIQKKIYDIYEINAILFEYDQPLLA